MVVVPLYGAGRLLLPDLIKNRIAENLPSGSSLNIGKIESKSDLSILYENISFSHMNSDVFVPQMVVKPQISLQSPLQIIAPTIIMKIGAHRAIFQNSNIRVLISLSKMKDIQLDGNIEALDASALAIISNIDFLIKGFSSENKEFNVISDKAALKYHGPRGPISVTFESLSTDMRINTTIETILNANVVKVDLSELETSITARKFEAFNVKSEFQFQKDKGWVLPMSISATNLSSENSEILKNLHFSAIGRWGKKSEKCNLVDIQRNKMDCDKLIHLTNVDFFAGDGFGELKFQGDGICVTPRAGCRQKISSTIMAKDTAQIFSNIMRSGTINPLVGGIILGSLLSHPTQENEMFDHMIKFDVQGSQVFINGEPLIK